jgi:hypothetical protein
MLGQLLGFGPYVASSDELLRADGSVREEPAAAVAPLGVHGSWLSWPRQLPCLSLMA